MAVKKRSKFEIVMDSFPLFCKNFVKIVDNNGELIPFVLNKEQGDFIGSVPSSGVKLISTL